MVGFTPANKFPRCTVCFHGWVFCEYRQNQKEYLCIFTKSGGRLLLPYLVWSVLYLAKDYVLNRNISVRHIIYSLCFGKAATPLYYIVVMVKLTLLTPWLVKLKKRRWLNAVTPIYLVMLYIFNIITGEMPRLYETFFSAWFIFYIMGMDCRNRKWDNVISRMKNWYIPIGLCISFAEAVVLLKAGCDGGFALSQIKISSFLYTAVIALVLMNGKNRNHESKTINNILASIGYCSYGIFYVHMLVLLLLEKPYR